MAQPSQASEPAADIGVGTPTGDVRFEAAMSPDRFDTAVEIAIGAVDQAAADGADLLILGELGIGNTTIAAALAAFFTSMPIEAAVGRGTGVDDDGLLGSPTIMLAATAHAVDALIAMVSD